MSTRPPVKDWATDFDHIDPRWIENPFSIWDELRQRCPVAHSERFEGGAYFPSRYAGRARRSPTTPNTSPRGGWWCARKLQVLLPSAADYLRSARAPRGPHAAPAALQCRRPWRSSTPGTQALCARLIDRFIGEGRCDAATAYAQHIPTRVIAHMLGVPEDDGDLFRHWIKMALEVGIYDPHKAMRGDQGDERLFQGSDGSARGTQRSDDLISYVMRRCSTTASRVVEEKRIGALRLILIAGIDTTWSAIGASLWHLGTPRTGDGLVADPLAR